MNSHITIAAIIAVASFLGLGAVVVNPSIINANAQQDQSSDTVTIQKTGVSSTDPLPGHSAHQLVMALPPRSDGKVWVGTVTWTASKPVEVVVLHGYNSSITADAAHGQPLTAPFGNGQVAISLVKTSSGTPIASGSMLFAGNALAFHTLSGDKFTVTYTVSATPRDLSSSTQASSS
ncbi:MAG TPA: hypothetical protein VJ729_07195 [Nitrososphaeraceae archaeon]|nr:hypothetical protein [Nitrososphaeraceae archaeon]